MSFSPQHSKIECLHHRRSVGQGTRSSSQRAMQSARFCRSSFSIPLPSGYGETNFRFLGPLLGRHYERSRNAPACVAQREWLEHSHEGQLRLCTGELMKEWSRSQYVSP
jgi:hypothetical protein